MKSRILFMLALCVAWRASAQSYIITTVAGNGIWGTPTYGAPATASSQGMPYDIATDTLGNVYFASVIHKGVQKINTSGILSIFAGDGTTGFGGDGGPATAAQFYLVRGIAHDKSGNLYVSNAADYTDDMHTIRKIDASGTISLFAGSATSWGFSGDGGPASAALLHGLGRLKTDDAGNLYVHDRGNKRIRKIAPSGTITTVAGNGTNVYAGDGSAATATGFSGFSLFTVDPLGNIYIASASGNIIYKVNTAGITSIYAGDGISHHPLGPFYSSGDGGPATNAKFIMIHDIAADRLGNVFVLDPNKVRMINSAGIINTIAGQQVSSGSGHSGDGGIARYAELGAPIDIHISDSEIIYIAENNSNVIRKMVFVNWEPEFEAGSFVSLPSCTTGSTFDLDTLLRVHDVDTADTLVWTPIAMPLHGTLSASHTMGSNNGTVYPTGMSYTASAGYTGADSFLVQVYDGYEYDTITVRVTIVSPTTGITGPLATCMGYTNRLSHSATGGTWSAATPSVVGINATTGGLTPVSVGTSAVTYTVYAGCYTTATVTVNDVPAAITGTTEMCAGDSVALSSVTPGGTWSSSNSAQIGVSSTGVATGVSAGWANISYTDATGCSSSVIVQAYVNPSAPVGPTTACTGNTTQLEDTLGWGGNWSSSAPLVATVGSTGIVSGISVGTATITYSVYFGCHSTAVVTVNESPAAITGANEVCENATITLASTTSGGAWSSSDVAVATVGSTGIVAGITPGAATISYTGSNGCAAIHSIYVNELPQPITGAATLCHGTAGYLYNATPYGSWSSSAPSTVSTDAATGLISGWSVGTATVSYTVYGGCAKTITVTVNEIPSVSGISAVCAGDTTTLLATPAGGTWMSYYNTIATVDTTGIVTGVAAGSAWIKYTSPAGCGIDHGVTVNALPDIYGTFEVCYGLTTYLYSSTGGTWSSSNTGVATVGSLGGEVYGNSAGTTNITYTDGNGCSAHTVLTVNPGLTAIMGLSNVCEGGTLGLWHALPGGTWSSYEPTIGTIDAAGMVTGVSAGTLVVSYTVPTGCYITKTITVRALPAMISGPATACLGEYVTFSSDVGVTWSSSGSSLSIGASTGIARGRAAGTYTITCTNSYGCVQTLEVTILPRPTIAGTLQICAGASTTLSSPDYPGGTWVSGNTSMATIGSISGDMTGIGGGTVAITYTAPNTCINTATATISTGPVAATITAPSPTMLIGGTQTITASVSGGTWTSSNTSIATINASTGFTVAVAAGQTIISYTLTDACGSTVTERKIKVVAFKLAGTEQARPTFSVYPNPTTGQLNVTAAIGGNLHIYSADGREVASTIIELGVNKLLLPDHLGSGSYVYLFEANDATAYSGLIEMVK